MIKISISKNNGVLAMSVDSSFVNKNDVTNQDLITPFSAPFDYTRNCVIFDNGVDAVKNFENIQKMMSGLYSDFDDNYRLELNAKDESDQNAAKHITVVEKNKPQPNLNVSKMVVSAQKNSPADISLTIESNFLLPASLLDRVTFQFDSEAKPISMLVLNFTTQASDKQEGKANSTYTTIVNCVTNTSFLNEYVARTGITCATEVYNKTSENKKLDLSSSFMPFNTQKVNRYHGSKEKVVIDEKDAELKQTPIQNLPLLTNYLTKSQVLKNAQYFSKLTRACKNNQPQANEKSKNITAAMYEYECLTPSGEEKTIVAQGNTKMNKNGSDSDIDKKIGDLCKSGSVNKKINFSGLSANLSLKVTDGNPKAVNGLYDLLKSFLSSNSSQCFSYDTPSLKRHVFPVCGYKIEFINTAALDLAVTFYSDLSLSKAVE